jgi:preprotein translocase subunit SecD
LSLAACGESEPAYKGCHGLEVGRVFRDTFEAGVTPHQFQKTVVNIGPTSCFAVEKSASVVKTGKGHGVSFTIASSDADRFKTFTGGNVEQEVALLVDGVIVMIVPVASPLPPTGTLERPDGAWTEAQAERIRKLLID